MLVLEGIPAFYIPSLLGTKNDHDRVEQEGHNRAINPHQWDDQALDTSLKNSTSHHRQVLDQPLLIA